MKDKQQAYDDDGVLRDIVSKKEAKELGLDRYFTGKPCKRGHVSLRYVVNGTCLPCDLIKSKKYKQENYDKVLEYRKQYYQENREQILESKKQYHQENRDKILEYAKQYYKENREQILEYAKQYYQENRERINEYCRNRYSTDERCKTSRVIRNMVTRVLSLTKQGKTESTFETLDYSVEEFMFDMENKMLEDMTWENHGVSWHIDHIYPVSRYVEDGVEDPAVINGLDNLIPMYSEHNLEKSNQTLEEFLDSNPDLVYLYGEHIGR
ncbi:MAG: hypothetical protein CMF22_09750 [Idiomarinaceae bacterium]|nr:hypothetical protein [Idiomarinaceae bacterium]|tara:strand:+ start:19327 stop:20127 length:801 start_codon:yes stop_codon:yes gene_type:complete